MSWIATTPRDAATLMPSRDASTISSTRGVHVAVAERQAAFSRRIPLWLDHAAGHLERRVGLLSAALFSHSEW